MTAADRLLAALARLDPGERARHVVGTVRGLPAPDRAELLAGLGGRGPAARRLAVTAAIATGDADHLASALDDPSPAIRALALPGLPDGLLAEVVRRGALGDRRRAYARIARGGREALADGLLDEVRERWGDGEAAALLPGCSRPVVVARLAGLAYAVTGWSGLVHRHADAVAAHAAADLAAQGDEDRTSWWERRRRLVGPLAEHRPGIVLELAERWLTGPLPGVLLDRLHRLLAVDARRVVALVLADPDRPAQLAYRRLGRTTRDRLATLPDADLGALLRASGIAHALLVAVLRAVPPARRAAVFDAAHAGRDLAGDRLADEVVALLPHARRFAEARRMLGLPVVADEPQLQLRVTAFLPVEESRPVLVAATGSADADERAQAYGLLVRSAAATGDPAQVTAALALLGRVRGERDPVRAHVLRAVADVRPELVEPQALPVLDRLVIDALDARDTSGVTTSAVQRLAVGVAVHAWPPQAPQPGWALAALGRLGAWRAVSAVGPALATLPRGQERVVLARIRPDLVAAVEHGRPRVVLELARVLGRRAWPLAELQELLERLTRFEDDAVLREAVRLWLAAPRTRVERAERLVARDPSTIGLPIVFDALARHRVAPVDRVVLAGQRLRGRFGTGRAWWLPDVAGPVLRRWTDEQVGRYVGLLDRALADPGLDRSYRARLTAQITALRGADDATLGGDDVLVVEAALTGLGRGADPAAALPVLLRHVDGERARVALYAAARCAREVRPDRLPALPATGKVTALKELTRWQAAFRPPGAVDTLLAAWSRTLHRDVRIAVLAALRAFPGDERVWVEQDEAVRGERFLALAAVAPRPDAFPVEVRARYAAVVRRATVHPDPVVVRAAHQALPGWLPWAPDAGADLARGVTDLVGTATWRSALTAAVSPGVWTALPDLLPGIVADLLTLATDDGTGPDGAPVAAGRGDQMVTGPGSLGAGAAGDAEARVRPLRDVPARQRLEALVAALAGQGAVSRRHPGPVRRVADLLAADPTWLAAAAALRAGLVAPGDALATDLRALAELVTGRPLAAAAAASALSLADRDPAAVAPGADALLQVAMGPAGSSSGAGLLACGIVATAGPAAGWSPGWRDRLDRLRAHPDPDVRAAAFAIVTAEE